MANWGKQASSSILNSQPLSYTGSGTAFSTNFQAQTRQIRIISQINGWVAILQSTASMFSTTTYLSTYGGLYSGTFIAANTANGDYFTVNPGEILGFTSTSTSSGTLISLTEMT